MRAMWAGLRAAPLGGRGAQGPGFFFLMFLIKKKHHVSPEVSDKHAE